MIVATEIKEVWVDPKMVRELFNETTVGRIHVPTVSIQPREVDDDLGLELVEAETIEQKYGLSELKDNSFVTSLREQFARKGFLSEKQVACLR